MKRILLSFIFCSIFVYVKSQSAETLIKNFFAGFEMRDWNLIASQLSEDFTFASPNGDDHLNQIQFKEKYWGNVKFFKNIEFDKMVADGNAAFAMYNITTTDNKVAHNFKYYTFSKGKIKSIETFFGTGVGYTGNLINVK
jgi:SnoaL-like domain